MIIKDPFFDVYNNANAICIHLLPQAPATASSAAAASPADTATTVTPDRT